MKQLLFLLGLGLLAVTCTGYTTPEDHYFDALLKEIKKEVRNRRLDNVRLANVTISYKGPMSIRLNGVFSEGKLEGLDKMSRSGHCGRQHYSYGALSINCTLTLDKLKIKYKGKVKPKIGPSLKVESKTKIGPNFLFVEVGQGPYGALARQIRISGMGKAHTEISGWGRIGSNASLKEAINRQAAAEFHRVFSSSFVPAIGAAVTRTPFPRS